MTFAAAVVLATASTAVKAQGSEPDFRLDHFKCYRMPEVTGNTVPGPVRLEDQFDRALGIIELVEFFVPLRFCNPVEKRFAGVVSAIKNSEHHLTLYAFDPLDGKPIRGVVLAVNQFGKQKLEIESADILAVPTAKNPTGAPVPPADLDHYKCYYARGEVPGRLRVVGLADQFEKVRHKLYEPVLFCNPVQKTDVSGNVFPIQNREDHLTCYKISVATVDHKFAVIANQFTDPILDMFAAAADLLCLPTQKASFKLDPDFGLVAPGR
jgi:hypothetical protein